MNSFQVEQGTGKWSKHGRFSRMLSRYSLLFITLIIGAVLLFLHGANLTSFAQNLPKPQQVLGAGTVQNPACEGSPYQKPEAVSLQSLQPGLQYREDEPQFYTLYGSSVAELRGTITDCEVRKQSGDYHALTTYTLNWQYETQASGGQCTLVNVKIGLATNQYLPRLADGQHLSADDRTTWDAYYANLVAHENEHLEVNKKYAADLHAALTNLSVPCLAIEAHASTLVNAHVQQLNSANTLLDSQTSHGADTGAVL